MECRARRLFRENFRAWRRQPWFQAVVFLPLTLALLWLAFRRVDGQSLLTSLRTTLLLPVCLAMLVSVVSHLVRAYRWGLLLEPIAGRIPVGRTFYALMVGYFANLLLPRVGEVVRCVHLHRLQGPKTEESLGTVITERLCDLLMFGLITLLSLAVSLQRFGGFLRGEVFHPLIQSLRRGEVPPLLLWLLLLLVVGVVLVVLVYRGALGASLQAKFRGICTGLLRGLKSILRLHRPWHFWLSTLLLWSLYWLMTWLICQAFPATVHLPVSSSLILLVVGTFGMLIPVQGGFGSFHLAVALWLEVEGLTHTEGLALATISHGAQTVVMLVVPALLYLAHLFLSARANPSEGPISPAE